MEVQGIKQHAEVICVYCVGRQILIYKIAPRCCYCHLGQPGRQQMRIKKSAKSVRNYEFFNMMMTTIETG